MGGTPEWAGPSHKIINQENTFTHLPTGQSDEAIPQLELLVPQIGPSLCQVGQEPTSTIDLLTT